MDKDTAIQKALGDLTGMPGGVIRTAGATEKAKRILERLWERAVKEGELNKQFPTNGWGSCCFSSFYSFSGRPVRE